MRQQRFVLFALLTFGIAVLGFATDRQSVRDAETYVPTPRHFGHPVVEYTPLPEIHGILSCVAGWNVCRVRNMPLLDQTDSRLHLAPDHAYLALKGCYDTSIVTVVLTALANRDPKLTVINRTKSFMNIPVIGAVPKEVEQLKQQYDWAYDFQHAVSVGGKIPNPMYVHEALADVGGGKVTQPCNPYSYRNCGDASNAAGRAFSQRVNDDSVTNASIIGLLKKGYATLVAFDRYQLVIIPDGHGGIASRKFILKGTHKVVFSGFQPGKYPLLINDVGNGQRYRVRLSTDLSSLGISASVLYPRATHTFIEYEGKEDTNVNFIEEIDGLRIETGDPSPFPS